MNPQPPVPPMWTCSNCSSSNEGWRGRCRNCNTPKSLTVRRICRTPADAFAAGWEAGADDPPLTEEQCVRMAALLGPYIRPAAAEAA